MEPSVRDEGDLKRNRSVNMLSGDLSGNRWNRKEEGSFVRSVLCRIVHAGSPFSSGGRKSGMTEQKIHIMAIRIEEEWTSKGGRNPDMPVNQYRHRQICRNGGEE